jgi:hypothetical protein
MAITVQSNIAFGLWFKVHFCDEHHMAIPRLHGLRFDKAKVSWVLKAALLFLDARLLLGRVIGNIGELARFGRHGEQGGSLLVVRSLEYRNLPLGVIWISATQTFGLSSFGAAAAGAQAVAFQDFGPSRPEGVEFWD